MDSVRNISLRKKRTVKKHIGAPQPISRPVLLASNSNSSSVNGKLVPPERPRLTPESRSNSNLSLHRERSPASKEQTNDYIKRRYSQRITALPKDFGNAPAVPSLPSAFTSSPSRDPVFPAKSSGKINLDFKALEDPHLRSEDYVAQLLSNASEAEIRDFQYEMGKVKNRTSTDIQHNVHKNRDQFIKISQEAEKLKVEMRSLRILMTDLTTTLGQTNASLGISTDTVSARKYANRSSVANLEAMWTSHLQELWRRVEGSQRFLPAIAGRHVVHESGKWVELNTATWKPRRRVHLILLNDHLLVACEKKNQDLSSPNPEGRRGRSPQPPQIQLYAEKCLPVQDVEMTDLGAKSAPAIAARRYSWPHTSNAVVIRSGSESFTFATSDADSSEKPSFTAKFRKVAADIKKAPLGQLDSETQPSKETKSFRRESKFSTNKSQPESQPSNTANVLVEVDGRQQSIRWLENVIDDLDIDIALQHFQGGVERVELLRRAAKSNKSNLTVQDLVDGKVKERAGELSRVLIRRLGDTNSSMTSTQQHVAWLTRLGYEIRASEAYLKARSDTIRTRTSQCIDQGDLNQYLYQISFIYFTLIRNTIQIYQNCFAPVMASACIKWGKEHVDNFNLILAQQLKKLDPASDERKYCIERAQSHAAMLSDVGVDFRSLVGRDLDRA